MLTRNDVPYSKSGYSLRRDSPHSFALTLPDCSTVKVYPLKNGCQCLQKTRTGVCEHDGLIPDLLRLEMREGGERARGLGQVLSNCAALCSSLIELNPEKKAA